jgi:hypothetical protein
MELPISATMVAPTAMAPIAPMVAVRFYCPSEDDIDHAGDRSDDESELVIAQDSPDGGGCGVFCRSE